jgi:alkyldihydroxyacetonephosphate synthase
MTGGSSGEDQLLVSDDRTLIIDGTSMDQVIKIDIGNMMVTAQCGVSLAALEATVNEMGYTLGHAPQSISLAYMGGLVATRSIGQFSTLYGGIEDMVCGLEAVLPNGEVFRIKSAPRRAAGQDLRHIVIGHEGSLVFMTEVTVKLFTYYPDDMWKGGYIVDGYKTGLSAIREVIVKGYHPAVVRLYDKADVDHHYGSVKLSEGQAFMFFAAYGPKVITEATGKGVQEIAEKYGAQYIGTKAVDNWFENRNRTTDRLGSAEEFQEFRETHVYNFPMEICATWSEIGKIYDEVIATLPEKIPQIVMLGGHVSHCYSTGTNVYFVASIKIDDPDKCAEIQYTTLDALCEVVLKYPDATIVHHHGIGRMRVGRIKEELDSSFPLLRAIKDTFDPNGIMNPGCLLPLD